MRLRVNVFLRAKIACQFASGCYFGPMTHAELARMAKANLQTLAESLVPADALKTLIAAHEIVFALFPDTSPRGWDLHIIKGKTLVVDATDDQLAARSTTAIACSDLAEALAMDRSFGDGRPH